MRLCVRLQRQMARLLKTYTIHVTKVEGAVSDSQVQEEGVQLKTPERLITVLPASEGLDIPDGIYLLRGEHRWT